jgi:DNA-directed RNA polymerase, beta'' subunit/160 kD subunit
MASFNNEFSNLHPSRVVGIQFGLMSPEEIRNGSVCEIITRDTYENNKPKIGGLFDPRMGVLDPGLICPTDGQDYIDSPGYFGHIELGKPVFYIQYLNIVIKILKCICFKCSKLLISKDKFKEALNMLPEERWNFVYSKCNSVSRCGQEINDGCGCKQPSKIRKEGLATLYADFALKSSDETDNSDVNTRLTPELVLKIFKKNIR